MMSESLNMARVFFHDGLTLEVGKKYSIGNPEDPYLMEVEFRDLVDKQYVVFRRPSLLKRGKADRRLVMIYKIMHIDNFKRLLRSK